jgi:hypothetical protein
MVEVVELRALLDLGQLERGQLMLRLDKEPLPRSARAPERISRLGKHESVGLKDRYPSVGWRKIS